MKSRFFQLSIFTAIVVGMVSAQGAMAQEQQRGARFNFAPNIWKAEEPRIPNGRYAPQAPAHAVKHGSMPQSSNFLLDPSMIPTPVRQEPAAPVVATRVTPRISVPSTNYAMPKSNYQPEFGKPLSAPPMAVASLPTTPAMAPKPQAAQAPIAKPAFKPTATTRIASAPHRHHVQTGVNGKLLTRPRSVGQAATPAVASYGKNFGYQPGGYLPTQTGSGVSTRQEVSGRLIHH